MKYGERSLRRNLRNQNLGLGLYRIGIGLSSEYLLGTLMCAISHEPERRGMLALLYTGT